MEKYLQEKIIEDYVSAYNNFDIEGMLTNMHPDIQFSNIINGKTNLHTDGIKELRDQMLEANHYFKFREQKIISMIFRENEIEATIHFTGITAVDIPEGPKAGNTISLNGMSIFRFKNDKIIDIKDIS